MSEKTKAANLTEDEIKILIGSHGSKLYHDKLMEESLERINYLNKRLKSFKEPETEVKSDNSVAGWGTNNG